MTPATAHDTIARRVRRTLDDAGASLVGRRVLALCSGGADSVALVALLAALPRGAAPRSIDVLFVDHGLRDSVDDERLAARTAAERVGARFHEVGLALALVDPPNVEAAARDARYARASELARELECDVVCTGHSASDQLEQALLALAGVTGRPGTLDAMPVVRELDGPGGALLVRPLLGCTRELLEDACRAAGLEWAVDPTNLDPEYAARNAVRHRVVPALLAVRDDAGGAIVRAAVRERNRAGATTALADALLDAWGGAGPSGLDVRRLATLPPAARRELLAAWLRRAGLGRALTERTVVAVDGLAMLPGRAACSRVDVGRSACVRRDGYDLTIVPAPDTEGPTP